MKRNVNVFLAVVLVAMLCGGLIWLRTAKEEKLGWNIHDTYGEAPAYANNGAAYTNATFAGPSNDGGVMTLSPSRAMRHSAASSYAGAYAISYGVGSAPLTSNLSPLTSAPTGAGLYTTSSKTFNSYGGGNGGAMSYSQSPIANRQSPIANSQSPIANLQSPIAYSTARRSDMTVGAGENLAQMAAENPVMAMTNAANAGMSNGFYGGYTAMDYSGSANYGQYTGMFGGGSRMGVRGRQNAPVAGAGNTWQTWLLEVWLPLQNGVWGTQGEDGNWYITEDQLRAAYDRFMADWNSSFDGPTFADWLAWFDPYGSGDGLGIGENTYFWAPVGDILPLLLIALLYMLFVAIKSKLLKSLLKTERSE